MRPRWGRPGPELGPLVAGTSSYVDGTFVWTDYVFDDRGPNLVDFPLLGPVRCLTPGGPDCSGGDAEYPAFAAPGNTADLVQLQIGTSGWDKLAVRAVLSSLVNPDGPGPRRRVRHGREPGHRRGRRSPVVVGPTSTRSASTS